MPADVIELCSELYRHYKDVEFDALVRNKHLTPQQKENAEIDSRIKAIQHAFVQAMAECPGVEPHQLWDAIYVAHVKAKSGIDAPDVIEKVVSAHQSWIKSSNHAYNELIKSKATEALSPHKIRIILQRDLTDMLSKGELANEAPDLEKFEEMKKGTFALYAVVSPEDGKNYCFGCIQCKTSIRERVKADREPSIQAMKNFFWSSILVLNGGFMQLPEFIEMVNGDAAKSLSNGWHGMYVFSNLPQNDRIYPTDLSFATFRDHAVQAADMWLKQRQWLNSDWRAK